MLVPDLLGFKLGLVLPKKEEKKEQKKEKKKRRKIVLGTPYASPEGGWKGGVEAAFLVGAAQTWEPGAWVQLPVQSLSSCETPIPPL